MNVSFPLIFLSKVKLLCKLESRENEHKYQLDQIELLFTAESERKLRAARIISSLSRGKKFHSLKIFHHVYKLNFNILKITTVVV